MAQPRAPAGTGAAGKRLRRDVLDRYELEPQELELLRRAVVAADLLDSLQTLLPDPDAEQRWRLTSITLARLIGAMKLPDSARPTRTGPQSLHSVSDGTVGV